jgi:hypothetical protein
LRALRCVAVQPITFGTVRTALAKIRLRERSMMSRKGDEKARRLHCSGESKLTYRNEIFWRFAKWAMGCRTAKAHACCAVLHEVSVVL